MDTSYMDQVEHISTPCSNLGESPVWNAAEQALYWVDIKRPAVFRYRPATGGCETFALDRPVTALGLRASGGFVAVTAAGFALWSAGNLELTPLVHPGVSTPEGGFNDGAVDPGGCFWAGTRSSNASAHLYRLCPGGSVDCMEMGITVSNGIGWSPAGTTMYFTDTLRRAIYAYDRDPTTGEIQNRRLFVRTPEGEGVPDGLAVDNEGFVWSIRCRAWKVVRYDPEGNVERAIRLPIECPTSCAFGGKNLNDLYVTSSRSLVAEEERSCRPLAGGLFRLRTNVRGQEEPLFAG